MELKNAERRVLVTDDGLTFELMERPEGLGTFEEYDRKVKEMRRQYPELFARLPSLDEYLKQRREEAARECQE